MARQSQGQKETVGRVMHEYKHGELESGSGRKVRNPKQAVAIALSEAGASNRQSPAENRHQRARTKAKESHGETARQRKEGKPSTRRRHDGEATRADLYAEARRRGIQGRSRMSKDALRHALAS
jgi:Family of unknown function (DUF6496)